MIEYNWGAFAGIGIGFFLSAMGWELYKLWKDD